MISIFYILEEISKKGSTDVTGMTNGLNTPPPTPCSYMTIVLTGNVSWILTKTHKLPYLEEWRLGMYVWEASWEQDVGWQIWIPPAPLEHTSDIGDHVKQDYSYVIRYRQLHLSKDKQHLVSGSSRLSHLTQGRILEQKAKVPRL